MLQDNTNEITRSCVIFKGAWFNNLNKNRTLDLYLKLLRDFNPHLLAIPCHDGHPLLYLMHVDFKNYILFLVKQFWLKKQENQCLCFYLMRICIILPRGYSLLKNLISINPMARQELAWYVCVHILKDERYSSKGWNIMKLLLDFNDKELGGKKLIHCFLSYSRYN